MSDTLKYFRFGFVGEVIQTKTDDYIEGRNVYEKALKDIESKSPRFIKGFKDGCRLLRRYEGDFDYDDGFHAGKRAFIAACRERKTRC